MQATLLEAARLLGEACVALPGDASNFTSVVELIAASTTVGLLFTVRRVMALQSRNKDLELAQQKARKQETALADREKQLQKERDAKRDAAQETKQEVGTLRKKNHALLEEQKKLRDQLRDEVKLRIEAQNTRPAFIDVEPRKPAVPVEEKKVIAKPVEAPAPAPAAAPAPSPEPAGPDPVLVARLTALEADKKVRSEQLEAERLQAQAHKEELKRLRRRVEDLRRIDLISKSKVELLEDKLRGLGRQYYDAISEVAALKGEVVPPRPRDLPRDEPDELTPAQHEADEVAAMHAALGDADPVALDTQSDADAAGAAGLVH